MVRPPDSDNRHPSRGERALDKLANPIRDSAEEAGKLTRKAIKASRRRLDRVNELLDTTPKRAKDGERSDDGAKD